MEDLPAPRQPARPPRAPRSGATPADALLSSYGGRLYAYFRLMLENEAAAKRALEDTLLAAGADAGRSRDPGQYAPRLFALARVECHKHEPAGAVGAGRHWTIAGGNWGGSRPGLSEIARRAVARLAPDVREVFLLSAPHNGLPLPQLAKVLGVWLDAADDLRTQAALEFAQAVRSCAEEADFTELSGTDLCVRAEESLARDASEPPPSMPILYDPALAAFREDVGAPPSPAPSPPASSAAVPPSPVSSSPVPTAPARQALTPSPPAPRDVPSAAPETADRELLELGSRLIRKRPGRRGRAVFAWVSVGIMAMAAVVIGANALMARPGGTTRLVPSGATPTGAMVPSVAPGLLAGSPRQSQPRPRHSRTATSAAPRPTYGIPEPSAPARTTKAPSPTPARSSARPSPKPTVSPSSSSPQPPPDTSSPQPPPGTSSP